MKYLVFGVQGMAGHMIARYLLEKGHKVIGFSRTESKICKSFLADARNLDDVKKAILSDDFDYVINAIGVLNQQVDDDLSVGIYLNSVFPHVLAKFLKDRKTKLVHISTDCVFEGTKGEYKEDDIPDAISYYGRTKALGEINDQKNLTIRTSIVGPELKENGVGLFHWFMSQKDAVFGYTNVIWSGITTLQLAKIIEKDRIDNRVGLIHLVNNRKISKYELLLLFQRYCRTKSIPIYKQDMPISDKSLISSLEQKPLIYLSYEEMICEMAEWIREHPFLYKQYLN